MSKKTILICSPSFSIRGGVESIINDLCHELPRRGWAVTLGLGKGSRFNNVAKYRETYPDLPIIEIDGTQGTRPARVAALKATIKKVKPDIVLSARIYDAYAAINELKIRSGSPRLAITIQSYESHYFYDARAYRESIDLCVAAGNMIRAAAIHWSGIPDHRVVSIPAVVRPPYESTSAWQPGDKLRIGYVGRLDQGDKRILDLVPLIKHLEKLRLKYCFRVVGDGAEKAILEKSLNDEVSQGKVVFDGWREHTQLYKQVYPELDCVVNFSPAEGVSVVGGEAMAHGVVPVFSRFVGMKAEGQYIDGVNSLTFPVGEIAMAAASIERLASEPGLLTRLSSEAAIRMHKGRYSFEGVIGAWAKSFDRCLIQPSRIGERPRISLPADGRLTRMGVPPAVAQRIRDIVGRRQIHSDPGSEWPTGSGLMTKSEALDLMRFAFEYENSNA